MRLAQIMAATMERYADRPAVGERAREFVRNPGTDRVSVRLLPRYETTSFGELWDRVRALAGDLHHHPAHALRPGDRVALLGFTSRDYATVDLAGIHLGAVNVPLQTSASPAQLEALLEETEPRVVAASSERLEAAVDAVAVTPSVQRLLVFDHHHEVDDQRERFDAARERLAAAGHAAVVEALSDVLRRADALPSAPLFVPDEGEDPLAMLIYTSGSTGTPKGAMYTERLAAAMWGGAWSSLFSDERESNINYMPMSHVAGHSSLKSTFTRGGVSYFTASSDLSTLLEDIGLARPTELSLVPRICEMLFQKFRSELDRRSTGAVDQDAVEAEVMADLRTKTLGGRVKWASSASAPLSKELTTFVESLLGLKLNIIYGSTEAAAVSVNGELLRPPVTDYRLADVPDLGYYRTDSPHPRGELLLKTEAMIPGYYRQPELTAELFDEDGYYRTGDIVAELEPGRIAILDRRKSVLKLSQGEFVATARLESIFAASPLVRQIFVYGNSERSYLLAVVVPTPDALDRAGGDTEDLKRMLSESMVAIAKDAGLNSYEIPRALLVETEAFSHANGLLSDHRKLLRPRLRERYGDRLEQLYEETAAREVDELRDVRRLSAERPVLETVRRAVRALLASPTTEVAATARFRELGGDSLSAVTFSDFLDDVFEVRVPVDMVISPASDLRRLADYIETTRAVGSHRATFAAVHGRDSTVVHADDLSLDKFMELGDVEDVRALPGPSGSPRTVLLTGASGYLGRFLCLEWLEKLAPAGGKVICLVRGQEAGAARARLDDAFAGEDPELAARFGELAEHGLEVLAGDIAEPRLGLDDDTWERLAREVDHIAHAGALVNHVLPYNHLFDANVAGTAELIRLGLTTRVKSFAYLSSVAVATASPEPSPVDEDADVRLVMPSQPVDGDEYASGYATSKWAGEVLLREAHDAYGLPVTTFRSNMILAHSRYAGQLNLPDMFTRLLHSVLTTRIAPRSFYRTDDEGTRPRAHYDGLPVDFTAATVIALGGSTVAGYRTFNLVNPHDDGISLDTFVDWLVEDGHRIERVDDYGDWLARFEQAIRAQPDARREHSMLPLIHSLREPEEPIRGSAIPSARFRAAVQDIPRLSRSLIAKYVTDLERLKVI
ncbi:thioester reductase domain-containing protein [Allokutzneria sp. A3M-2-11 16]|nr:thioester reductase domain-containing protein [Allokutzneria sp. A3M-2-11 16]